MNPWCRGRVGWPVERADRRLIPSLGLRALGPAPIRLRHPAEQPELVVDGAAELLQRSRSLAMGRGAARAPRRSMVVGGPGHAASRPRWKGEAVGASNGPRRRYTEPSRSREIGSPAPSSSDPDDPEIPKSRFFCLAKQNGAILRLGTSSREFCKSVITNLRQ